MTGRPRMHVTPKRRIAVYAKTDGRCAGCGLQFAIPDGYDGRFAVAADYRDKRGSLRICILELDHIIPRKIGGTNEVGNLQPLCTQCNCRKGARVGLVSCG